jgi:hypothetical protein
MIQILKDTFMKKKKAQEGDHGDIKDFIKDTIYNKFKEFLDQEYL